MRLAFKAIGDDERSQVTDAETIWADSETRSFGELIDGLTKLSTLGVPQEVLWSRAGFSPTEIDRMRGMQETDAFLAAAGPEPPTNGQVPPEQARQVVTSAS